ncbi:uncharacterized protein LOC133781420 isoform X2 [Humulus lupulus]|uniref:uncharacterized protein LOC133781420 isoform X2 n=1 Tax=Humulus lupulus TaxID=3486 RepID=UPI002B40965E|nr:uncharacterized protein LOC133781420 isoform X2 [Humulus lupulus]
MTVLYLSVPSENILPEKLFSEKLERYQVSIGGDYNRYKNEFPRWLQLNLSNMNEKNASGLKSLIKRSEYLSLERLVDVTNVVHDLDKDGFPRLKHLRLIQLTSLEMICHGKLPTGSFNELRKVEVRSCDRLKNLFPLSVTKLLHEIRVEECKMMEEIVNHGRESEGDDEASHNIDESFQLRSLFLHFLPNFVHFYFSKLKTTGESSLVDYSKPLFNETVSFANLEKLTLKKLNIEKLWPKHLLSNSYGQKLTSLEVRSCDNLKYMFSFTLAQCFVNLRSLKVGDCKTMENICVTTEKFGEEESQLKMILFPELKSIEFDKLSALQRFCATESCMEFPLLSKLTIEDCVELKTFVSSSTISAEVFLNEKVSLPNLKELVMKKLDIVILWPDQPLSSCDLQNLTSLKLESCKIIEYLFCFSMTERIVNLKEVKVYDCVAMKDILRGRKTGEERRSSENNTLFAKLETLHLSRLPVCKTFCSEDSYIEQVSVGDDEGKIIPRSKHFFNGIIAFPNLKELTISHCNNMKYLFLSSVMAQILVPLKTLRVWGCENIKEVIISDEESGGGSKSIIFEKLESLQLIYLPNIIKFCDGDDIECPLLSTLVIEGCPKLKEFISNSMSTVG